MTWDTCYAPRMAERIMDISTHAEYTDICRRLLKDIKAELDVRGLTMALNRKNNTVPSHDITGYQKFVDDCQQENESLKSQAIHEIKGTTGMERAVLKDQIITSQTIGTELSAMNQKIVDFKASESHLEQKNLQKQLESGMERICALQYLMQSLTEERTAMLETAAAKSSMNPKNVSNPSVPKHHTKPTNTAETERE